METKAQRVRRHHAVRERGQHAAEVARLRAQVAAFPARLKEAYAEAWTSGRGGDYSGVTLAWQTSDTKAALDAAGREK